MSLIVSRARISSSAQHFWLPQLSFSANRSVTEAIYFWKLRVAIVARKLCAAYARRQPGTARLLRGTSTGLPPPTAAARSPAPRPDSTTSPRTLPRSTPHYHVWLSWTGAATSRPTSPLPPWRPTPAPIQASERRGRVLAMHCLLNDIAEWGLRRPVSHNTETPQRSKR